MLCFENTNRRTSHFDGLYNLSKRASIVPEQKDQTCILGLFQSDLNIDNSCNKRQKTNVEFYQASSNLASNPYLAKNLSLLLHCFCPILIHDCFLHSKTAGGDTTVAVCYSLFKSYYCVQQLFEHTTKEAMKACIFCIGLKSD